jgi:hypothetical protein
MSDAGLVRYRNRLQCRYRNKKFLVRQYCLRYRIKTQTVVCWRYFSRWVPTYVYTSECTHLRYISSYKNVGSPPTADLPRLPGNPLLVTLQERRGRGWGGCQYRRPSTPPPSREGWLCEERIIFCLVCRKKITYVH